MLILQCVTKLYLVLFKDTNEFLLKLLKEFEVYHSVAERDFSLTIAMNEIRHCK